MNIFKTLLNNFIQQRKQRKIKAAHKLITDSGLFVVNIQHRAGTNYLVDMHGIFYKIGKRL